MVGKGAGVGGDCNVGCCWSSGEEKEVGFLCWNDLKLVAVMEVTALQQFPSQ